MIAEWTKLRSTATEMMYLGNALVGERTNPHGQLLGPHWTHTGRTPRIPHSELSKPDVYLSYYLQALRRALSFLL